MTKSRRRKKLIISSDHICLCRWPRNNPLVVTMECMGRELDKLVVYALICGVSQFVEGGEVSVSRTIPLYEENAYFAIPN